VLGGISRWGNAIAVGTYLQGPDDHSGGYRPPGTIEEELEGMSEYSGRAQAFPGEKPLQRSLHQ